MLDPLKLQDAFVGWVQSLETITGGKVLAIDGKALRGTATSGKANSFVHMVSVWAAEAGLTLAQDKVDSKSNEITAIPKLLEMIEITDCIITIDAMGTQTAIADLIQDKGADYVLALKGNQSTTHDEIMNFFDQAEAIDFEGVEVSSYHTVEKGHGRYEQRHIYACEDLDWLPCKEKWTGLRSIILIVSERTLKGKTSVERRYYISSLPADARALAYAIRSHWGIENQCHWVLDVSFREDSQKAKSGNIPQNMSLLRRMALNILKQDKSSRRGIECKRKEAGWDCDYLLQLLGIKFS